MLAATRAELILPTDAVPGTSFALLIVKQPKTQGRSAKHQAARIDQRDVIEFLTAMYGRSDPSDKLWPFSASTLRKRFSMLLAALELPERRQRSAGHMILLHCVVAVQFGSFTQLNPLSWSDAVADGYLIDLWKLICRRCR